MASIAVIDYGMGNLRSVAKAIEHIDPKIKISVTADADQIRHADRIVFPGQGAIGSAMAQIKRLGLDQLIPELLEKKPFLGICLGLQVLMQHSEENGGVDGFGIFPGQVRHFSTDFRDPLNGQRLKVPHMGWNQVHQHDHDLWHDIPQDSRFYFVHSYYVESQTETQIAGTTEYGQRFVSAMAHDNLFAVQFHPEKSQRAGLTLLGNFLRWDGQGG